MSTNILLQYPTKTRRCLCLSVILPFFFFLFHISSANRFPLKTFFIRENKTKKSHRVRLGRYKKAGVRASCRSWSKTAEYSARCGKARCRDWRTYLTKQGTHFAAIRCMCKYLDKIRLHKLHGTPAYPQVHQSSDRSYGRWLDEFLPQPLQSGGLKMSLNEVDCQSTVRLV